MRYRKNIRLKDFDYRQDGAYFVTICTDFKEELIGQRERLILEEELNQLLHRFEGISLDYFVIMPNHLHIIFLFSGSSVNLPKLIQAFKSITTLRLKRQGAQRERFWQKNYYEIREYIQTCNQKSERVKPNNPLALELKFERDKNRKHVVVKPALPKIEQARPLREPNHENNIKYILKRSEKSCH